MKVIVKISINLRHFFSSFFYFRNPRGNLLFTVSIIKPRSLSSTMPTEIRKISCQMHLRRQQRLIHINISYIKLLQQLPSFNLLNSALLFCKSWSFRFPQKYQVVFLATKFYSKIKEQVAKIFYKCGFLLKFLLYCRCFVLLMKTLC